jgi:hypothetical protein
MTQSEHNPTPDPQIPESLGEALRRERLQVPAIPGLIDRAVLGAARDRAVVINRQRARKRVLARLGVMGLAAVVILAVIIAPRVWRTPTSRVASSGAGRTFDPRDINHDGVVDILDAYALARAMDQGDEQRLKAIRAEWNAARDGALDRSAADRIAMTAVRLTPPAEGGGNG